MQKIYQQTFNKPISFKGVGLHSGKSSKITIIPGEENQGIIFKRTSKRLGIKFEKHKYSNPDKAMLALDKNLENGIPTGMLVGVYHLTYFPDPYRFHFNAHNLVVFGKKDNNYLISDCKNIIDLKIHFCKNRFPKGKKDTESRIFNSQ